MGPAQPRRGPPGPFPCPSYVCIHPCIHVCAVLMSMRVRPYVLIYTINLYQPISTYNICIYVVHVSKCLDVDASASLCIHAPIHLPMS